jgi:hypothetical protein
VGDNEKVEITINCKVEAFLWIIKYLSTEDGGDILETINSDNCLHLIVSANFLGLKPLYEIIWRIYFRDFFTEVMNKCIMNLKNLNKNIIKDIARYVEDE